MIQIRDYTVDDCSTNNAYSIEMEYHSALLGAILRKVWIEQYYNSAAHDTVQGVLALDSGTGEYSQCHTLSPEKRKKFLEMAEDVNRYKIYFWGDRFTSGWNHFHVFFKGVPLNELQAFVSANWEAMKAIMKSAPLYALYYPGTGFHKRRRWVCTDWDTAATSCSKWSWFCINNFQTVGTGRAETLNSFEFRINQAFDRRLYGYYAAVILMAMEWVELPNQLTPGKANLIWEGVKVQTKQIRWRWHYDIRSNTVTVLSPQELTAVSSNVAFMVQFLRDRWLSNSANMLDEYWREKSTQETNKISNNWTPLEALLLVS